MNLLITNLSEIVHQGDRGDEEAAGHEEVKLIMKPSQKVVGLTKLKCSRLISVGLASGRRQLRAKSVKLTLNNRKLIE
jgi:hypothetical protein